jgi:hypothetical protein
VKPSRVHRIGPPDHRPRRHERAPDYLVDGRAWARVQLLRDGRVVIDGQRGGVTLDEDHGREVQAMFRLLGVRER